MAPTTRHELTESDYAEIGRALVERAEKSVLAKIRDGAAVKAHERVSIGFEAQVSFEHEDGSEAIRPEALPIRCCICFLEYDVIICKGWCCQ